MSDKTPIIITIKRNEIKQMTISFPSDSNIDEIREEVLIPLLTWYGFHEETIKEILPDIH
jgi:hypothetical protein